MTSVLFLPARTFTDLCITLREASDGLLAAVKATQGDDMTALLTALTYTHRRIDALEAILLATMIEQTGERTWTHHS